MIATTVAAFTVIVGAVSLLVRSTEVGIEIVKTCKPAIKATAYFAVAYAIIRLITMEASSGK